MEGWPLRRHQAQGGESGLTMTLASPQLLSPSCAEGAPFSGRSLGKCVELSPAKAPDEFHSLTGPAIQRFIASRAAGLRRHERKRMCAAIRAFLRFLLSTRVHRLTSPPPYRLSPASSKNGYPRRSARTLSSAFWLPLTARQSLDVAIMRCCSSWPPTDCGPGSSLPFDSTISTGDSSCFGFPGRKADRIISILCSLPWERRSSTTFATAAPWGGRCAKEDPHRACTSLGQGVLVSPTSNRDQMTSPNRSFTAFRLSQLRTPHGDGR